MSESEYLHLMLVWRCATAVSALALVLITLKRMKEL